MRQLFDVTIVTILFVISTVGEAPALKGDVQDVTTKLGESGTLTCAIVGRPLPEIKWYRYGKELIQSRKYKVSSDGRNHSLSILTDEQEDEGVYTCRAVNDAGEIETSGKLRLQAAPQFHPGFPPQGEVQCWLWNQPKAACGLYRPANPPDHVVLWQEAPERLRECDH